MWYGPSMPSASTSITREIHRRRMVAGDKSSYNKTIAEVAVFKKYGKMPDINSLHTHGKAVDLAGEDDGGMSFLVVHSEDGQHWLVDPEFDYASYVFVHGVSSSEYDIVGWLPLEELDMAPMRGDQREVTADHFFKMPEDYHFQPVCARTPCEQSGIWDYSTDSWDCFGGCGKHRYDNFTSVLISKQDHSTEA